MPTSSHESARPTSSTRDPSTLLWAEGKLLGVTAVLADSADAILGAALTHYDENATPTQRLASRQHIAFAMASKFQEIEIRAAEDGGLGKPWTWVGQTRLVRSALLADRRAPLPEFINVWPTNQPRLVVVAHPAGDHSTPRGNVLVLDPTTSESFLHSLSDAKVVAWGELS